MNKRIVILTGSELRHSFFRKYLGISPDIEVLESFCEGEEKSHKSFVAKQTTATTLRSMHLANLEESAHEVFGQFVRNTDDKSNPIFLLKGHINEPAYTNRIIELKPDLLIAYGCSLIKEPLLSTFKGRFLNAHLGLSPYYRGSSTNFWPLVNGEPEYVGVTFMHIDPGIDTGEIIHQIRADIVSGDTPSSIGNRLIVDMTRVYCEIIRKYDSLPRMLQPVSDGVRVYRQSNYSEESVDTLYRFF